MVRAARASACRGRRLSMSESVLTHESTDDPLNMAAKSRRCRWPVNDVNAIQVAAPVKRRTVKFLAIVTMDRLHAPERRPRSAGSHCSQPWVLRKHGVLQAQRNKE